MSKMFCSQASFRSLSQKPSQIFTAEKVQRTINLQNNLSPKYNSNKSRNNQSFSLYGSSVKDKSVAAIFSRFDDMSMQLQPRDHAPKWMKDFDRVLKSAERKYVINRFLKMCVFS